jgi:ubiquinone/menaquinone biosynthesis C-methylase UbiE
MARTYYEVLYMRQALEAYLKQSGQPLSKTLEIGCGFGRLSPYIADVSTEHYAVDINTVALQEASSLYPNVHFLEASATDLPFEDNTFDCIITWTVLQHIMPNLIEDALSEINRCAKDSALIILCEATRYHGKSLPNSHTQDRSEEFYKGSFSNRVLVKSTDFNEIDNIDGMETPGRFMVFYPKH